jgi:predicted nuclease of restriction endonuclease-like (RecB) superfamily
MSKGIRKPAKSTAAMSADYAPLLAEIKARVQSARIKAGLAANRELLALYWDIGRLIVEAQRTKGYGKKVVAQLAADLQREFPGVGGFSPINVWRMRAFYTTYSDSTGILSQAVTESSPGPNLSRLAIETAGKIAQLEPIVQAPLAHLLPQPPEPFASLPWGHNLLLLHKLEKPADRLWYAAKAVEHGWSRNVLALQIETGLHRRQGKAVTNFQTTLPPAQSDLAQGITKDPYLFDFLTLRDDANERAVEDGLLAHVEKFLLELGAGFALVGRQVHLEVGDRDFYLDLLFYHLKLRCFVVIDLKACEFTPEAAGKMNFYLSAADDRFRQPGDQPSIGLILCRSKNRVIAEYALRDMTKPIGVSGYVTKLVDSLPKSLKGAVPSVADLEKGLTAKTP